jgi:hypothetical protein
VFIGAAGSNQTPNVRTASTAFTFDATNNLLGVSSLVGPNVNVNILAGSFTTTIDNTGNIVLPGNIAKTTSNNVSDIGTSTNWWNTVFATTMLTGNLSTGASGTVGKITGTWQLNSGSTLQATYADLAEKYSADAYYEPGTVLVFGGNQEVTISNNDMSYQVAGVVSTNPAFILNSNIFTTYIVDLALIGRVPTKVLGPVKKGDLMVSTYNGLARAENNPAVGTVIGKSLEDFNSNTIGTIQLVVGKN